MLKWGSKMRPPFLNDLEKDSRTTGQPTRESKASQIPEIPMFRALLKTRPFLPWREAADFRALPLWSVPCQISYFRAMPCLVTGSWYQDLGTRILVPGSWCHDLGTSILEPGSWYQDPGTKILAPRSWYQDPNTKILVPRSQGRRMQRPLSWNHVFLKNWPPDVLSIQFCACFWGAQLSKKCLSREQ